MSNKVWRALKDVYCPYSGRQLFEKDFSYGLVKDAARITLKTMPGCKATNYSIDGSVDLTPLFMEEIAEETRRVGWVCYKDTPGFTVGRMYKHSSSYFTNPSGHHWQGLLADDGLHDHVEGYLGNFLEVREDI